MGEPQHVTKRMDAAGEKSESWGYGYSSNDSASVTYIPIAALFTGKSTANIASLSIMFTSDGIVSRITRHNEQGRSGREQNPAPAP